MPGRAFGVDAHQQACALRAFQRFHGLGQRRRAPSLSAGATASSQSAITMSAPLSMAFPRRSARGRNEKKGGGLSRQIVHAYVLKNGLFGRDAGGLDDLVPAHHFGLQVGAQAFGRGLLRRYQVGAELGDALS
jgi:hypothetical protein